MTLNWEKILSSETETPRSERREYDKRSPFDSDYSRITFSSPFRRLQDKTQVFPLEKNDFVRTRLTHSKDKGFRFSQQLDEFISRYLKAYFKDASLLPNLARAVLGWLLYWSEPCLDTEHLFSRSVIGVGRKLTGKENLLR